MRTSTPVTYDGLKIDYDRMGEEDLVATLLSIAERRGLLQWHETTVDGHYSISVGDRMFPPLTADETRGAVIGIAIVTGDGLHGLAYRPGLGDTGSVDRAPHER